MKTNLWEKYEKEEDRKLIEDFCCEYKTFLSANKTERECVAFAKELALKNGFKPLEELISKKKKLKAGDKVFAINMDKAMVLFVVGENDIEKGLNITGSHLDSPRLDLKAKPLYESSGFCLIDTHYYGGIKKYQWTASPLALHGVVVHKDGSKTNIVIGEEENDPIFAITDLLPHLEKGDKKDIKGEDLDLLAGNIADTKAEKDKFKTVVMNILKQKGIEENDFFSAEFEVVPAGKARDCGLDRSMLIGYGHDDRVCAYTSLKAFMEVEKPKTSAVCLLVDKEEIGSVGATGMHSKFFENTIAEIMNLCGQYSELGLRRTLAKSNMLSSDVTAAVDPTHSSPFNSDTDAHFAKGISFSKFTGYRGKYDANDANPEFIAKLRDIFDKEGITYQATEMGKVDEGGGGTIAYIMANYGMNVIDAGVPVLNMHAPWEIVSKADVFETYKAYKAFYKMDTE